MREKYESLSLATLKDLAKARGLKGVSTLRKPELIERMLQEDQLEKEENHKKHQEQAKEIMRKKRYKKQMEEKAIMDKLHRQAAIELSYFSSMSKVALRKNCSSAYNYNNKKERFELKDNMAYSNDMPKIIKY